MSSGPITLRLWPSQAQLLAGLCAHNLTVPKAVRDVCIVATENTDQGARLELEVVQLLQTIGDQLLPQGFPSTINQLYVSTWHTRNVRPQTERTAHRPLVVVGGRAVDEED